MTRSLPAALTAALLFASVAAAGEPLAPPNAPPPTASLGGPVATGPVTPPTAGVPFDAPGEAAPRGGRAWFDAEYLLWWMRGQNLPPLVTTSPAGTPMGRAGELGQVGTAVLFGDSTSDTGVRSGFRLAAGTWIDQGQIFGVEAGFLLLETKASNFGASSPGSPILARPFTDATTGQPAALRVAFPGELSGSIIADATTTGLIGADLLFRDNLLCGPNCRLDVLGGYRFLRFADRLDVQQEETSLSANNPNLVVPGTRINAADQFSTKNEFNGFDFGLDGAFHRGRFDLDLCFNLLVGFTKQDVDIFGLTTVDVPGAAPVTRTGGLLALSPNIGHFSRGNEVSVIPMFDAKLGYQFTPNVKATLGYTVLYWNNVVRAADQVDTTVNPTLLPGSRSSAGALRPAFELRRGNIWVDGLELGLEFCF